MCRVWCLCWPVCVCVCVCVLCVSVYNTSRYENTRRSLSCFVHVRAPPGGGRARSLHIRLYALLIILVLRKPVNKRPHVWCVRGIFQIAYLTRHTRTLITVEGNDSMRIHAPVFRVRNDEAVAVGTPPRAHPPPLPRPVRHPRQTHRAITPPYYASTSPPSSCGRHVGLHVLTLRAPCLLVARLRPHGGGEPIRVDA